MRIILFASLFSLAACSGFKNNEPVDPDTLFNGGLEIPESLKEALRNAIEDAKFKGQITGSFTGGLESGFFRLTDVDCQEIANLLNDPAAEIDSEFREFMEKMIFDGNVEINADGFRLIATCDNDSYDPSGAFGL